MIYGIHAGLSNRMSSKGLGQQLRRAVTRTAASLSWRIKRSEIGAGLALYLVPFVGMEPAWRGGNFRFSHL